MTEFHDWEDVEQEIFDAEDRATIKKNSARMVTGIRLGELRKRLGLTQREIARRMGVRQERVSAIERGDLESLQISSLTAYAEALGGEAHVVVEIDGQSLQVA